jgi:hypothetical protein
VPGLPPGPGHGKGPPGPKRAANEAKDLGTRDEIVNSNLRELDDFTAFELDGGEAPKDANVPGVLITNTREDEWRDIIQHFDLAPIAYPDSKTYFVLIDVFGHTLQKAEGEQAFKDLQQRYAPNGIAIAKRKIHTTPVFGQAADLASQRYEIPENQVNVMILAPRQVMAYLAWKAMKAVRDEGFPPGRVRACRTRFTHGADGGWVLTVIELILADGSIHKVPR